MVLIAVIRFVDTMQKRLFHHAVDAERPYIMVRIFLNTADKTVFDVHNFVGLVCHTALVCYHNDGYSLFSVQLSKQLHHLDTCFRVECTRRFVGQNNLWVSNQCACNGYTLLLSARQFVGIMFCIVPSPADLDNPSPWRVVSFAICLDKKGVVQRFLLPS